MPKSDAGAKAQAYYEQQPTSKAGEFAHADAKVADLNAMKFSDTPEQFNGSAPMTSSKSSQLGAGPKS